MVFMVILAAFNIRIIVFFVVVADQQLRNVNFHRNTDGVMYVSIGPTILLIHC